MKAFQHLQSVIGPSGLSINCRKSSMTYFHQDTHPLSPDVTITLQQLDIPIIENHTVILGSLIGRSIEEMAAGVGELAPDPKTDLFFRRLTNPNLAVQTAMILLRLCGVPKMSYLLRVTPPDAIYATAARFDQEALLIAHKLLGIEGYEAARSIHVTQQLQAPLRYGGFGITSATATSHSAYLASVATAAQVSVLHAYTASDKPLPSNTILHSQLSKCIDTIKAATPATANLLPNSASTFFSHYEHESTVAVSSLQSAINQLATKHIFNATIDAAEAAGDITTVARLRCITAPHASDWKAALPSNSHMILQDVHYRVTALFNLGMDMPDLPPDCHGCGSKDKVANDPYHYLSCTQHKRKEITIGHNILVHVLYVYNNMSGGTAVKEPQDLHDDDGRRPDLQMITNNQHILTDVQITNPLLPDI
jgi:hypothetical protein